MTSPFRIKPLFASLTLSTLGVAACGTEAEPREDGSLAAFVGTACLRSSDCEAELFCPNGANGQARVCALDCSDEGDALCKARLGAGFYCTGSTCLAVCGSSCGLEEVASCPGDTECFFPAASEFPLIQIDAPNGCSPSFCAPTRER